MRLKVLGLVCGIWLGLSLPFLSASVGAPAAAAEPVSVLLAQSEQLREQDKSVLAQWSSTTQKMNETARNLADIQKQLDSLHASRKQYYKDLGQQYGSLLVPVVAAFQDQASNLQSIEEKLIEDRQRLLQQQTSLQAEKKQLVARRAEIQYAQHSTSQAIVKATNVSYTEGNLEGLDLEKLAGIFAWPVPTTKEISSDYGWRNLNGSLEFHTGIDVAAEEGTPIHATADGTVLYAGPAQGFGNWIVLRHENNLLSIYGHMYRNGILVKPGQKVRRGSVIGRVGAAGQSYGPHLHYGVAYGMQGNSMNTVNPWVFLPPEK